MASGEPADLRQLQAIATAYFADRASRVTAAGPLATPIPQVAAQAALSRTHGDRLAAVRAQLNHLHGGYRRAATSIQVGSVDTQGSRLIARVTEQTDLYYAVVAPGDVDHMTYWVDHELELHRTGSTWRLARAQYLPANPFSTPATQFEDELPADMRQLNARRAAGAATAGTASSRRPTSNVRAAGAPSQVKFVDSGPVTLSGGYDYTAMVNYARAWATGRNPAYPSYSDDCTNFASQVMRAGGWQTVGSWPFSSRSSNSNWWYGSYASTSSYTWGGAENWYWFATGSGRTYIIYMYDMGSGDVLQYDYDFDGNISHTQVCTGRDSTGPLMTQHGSDYRDKRLTEIMASASNYNAWKYAHRT
ncbi:amidase domain-containing protein [Plantactinospora siamensis]|uniref:Amidase domain-containing protein n=1 Tax=Plantactinospora siamensis TaxID=555372 RepID=A0ABV6P3T6_9ACTN